MVAVAALRRRFLVGGGAGHGRRVDDLTPPGDMVDAQGRSATSSPTPAVRRAQKCTIGTQNGTPRDSVLSPSSATTVGAGARCATRSTIGNGRAGDNCARRPHLPRLPRRRAAVPEAVLRARATAPRQGVRLSPRRRGRSGMTEGGVQALHALRRRRRLRPGRADGVHGRAQAAGSRRPTTSRRVGMCLNALSPGMAGDTCTAQADCAPGFRCDSLLFCRGSVLLRPAPDWRPCADAAHREAMPRRVPSGVDRVMRFGASRRAS